MLGHPTTSDDSNFTEIARLGNMRRLQFSLEFGSENERKNALEALRETLREDPTFAYAELLAARHRIWEASADVLPSFAAAFEDALLTEDREKLKKLEMRQPRLEALILVARALYGDTQAEQKVGLWLSEPEISAKNRR